MEEKISKAEAQIIRLKPYATEYKADGTIREITEQEYLMGKDSYPRKGKQKYWKCKYYNEDGELINYYLKAKSRRDARESVVVEQRLMACSRT